MRRAAIAIAGTPWRRAKAIRIADEETAIMPTASAR
jgi:hypothetical protein